MIKTVLASVLLSSLALAQVPAVSPASGPRPPLVACEMGQYGPCVVIATRPSDMAGVWKQYQSNPIFAPSGGMGFIRYGADGHFVISDTAAGTAVARAPFPSGSFSFDGTRMTLSVLGVSPSMPECARGVYEVRVIRVGSRKVGLQFSPINDTCRPRLSDVNLVQLYVAPAP